jgi:prophage regulatory protein
MANRLIRLRAVVDKTGSNTTDIYAGMKAGTFPKSVPIGTRTVGWVESEVDKWIADRIAKRDARGGRRAGPGRGRKLHSAEQVA